MIFLSYWFYAFAAFLLLAYWLLPFAKLRLGLILASSLVFLHHFSGPAGIYPILLLAALTYGVGLSANRQLNSLAIAANVLVLVFYKYTLFILASMIGPLGLIDAATMAAVATRAPSVPPLAISFFVFEFVHYLVEVRRGHGRIRSPLDFSIFALFWPTLVAGPIKRFPDFLPELKRGAESVAAQDIAVGVTRIAQGLVLKFAADTLAVYIDANTVSGAFGALALHERWLVVIAISFRILFDFSGYSSLAIGFARLMGIRIPENFNWPYLAVNIQEFWRRWHISLSSWVRDYIYIPLGGSRHGPVRRIANGLIAFAIIGLWHGAGWNFILWGLYHGAGLALHSLIKPQIDRLRLPPMVQRLRMGLGWLLTYVFVLIGWVMFFFPSGDFEPMILQLFNPG